MKVQPKPKYQGSRRRKLLCAIITACAVLVLVGALFAILHLRRQHQLYADRDALIADLTNRRGEYDEQSIVLADTSRGAATALAQKLGATLRISGDGRFATLTLPEETSFLDVCLDDAYLADLPCMSIDYEARVSDWVDESEDGLPQPMRPQFAVTDDGYGQQTYLDYVNLRDAWNHSTASGILVAVIDTGIDTDHPEFIGRISEYSYNATEDKIVKDYLTEDGDYDWSLIEDEQGHGTSVAGVLGAPMDNGGIVGVAPNVSILVIKAECTPSGSFKRTSDLVFGLYYAIECDAKVVNMSFGSQSTENPFAEATRLAVDSDIICVAAAGNDTTAEVNYPACDPNVIGVGALENGGWELASYSNFGDNVDMVAPGTTYTAKMGGSYSVTQGTSLAAPVVAGAVALYASTDYYAEFSTVCELLYASCFDLGDLGHDWYFGYGALDISALLLEDRGCVTFNMMTDELDNTEQVFIRNHTLQCIPEPERLYAVFDGWYYDPQCTEEYDWYADEFSSDLTLYAHWVNEEDGIPYTYVELEDGTVEIRSYTGHRRYITIPTTIEGKSVSSIGRDAFAGESRLRQVNLPKNLVRIGPGAFRGCSNLVGIEIPDSVTEIGENAFFNNVRLAYVGFGANSQLISIGSQAFQSCARLRTVTLPASLTSVDGTAFQGTLSMTAYSVQNGNAVYMAEDGVLFTADRQTLVAYPAGVTRTYTLPASVKTVGTAAFAYSRIQSISLESVSAIGNDAFAYSRLTSLTLPDNVTLLGSGAFSFCASLQSLTLGEGLPEIPSSAFYLCQQLQAVEIPACVRAIGENAFAGTDSLTELTFAAGSCLQAIGKTAFSGSSIETLILPSTLQNIGDGAFSGCTLKEIRMDSNGALQSIGEYAFSQNYGLTEIVLPSALESIGAFAFQSTGLRSVTLPTALQSLGEGAFANCGALTEILIASESTVYASVDGILFDSTRATLIAYPAGNPRTEYTLPVGVTAIGAHAFRGAEALCSVSLSNQSLKKVSEYAFYGCSAVTDYTLPDTLTEIGRYAFAKNSALSSFQIPENLTQLSGLAFAECWNLSTLTFDGNSKLSRIGYAAFAYCGISDLRIPASVSSVAQGAFEGCTSLMAVTFEQNSELPRMTAYMFDGCVNLSHITFESGSKLTSLQAHALEGMRNLISIDFGDAKLTNIDNFAFRFCESLSAFGIPNGVTYVGRYAFYGCRSLQTVAIPESVEYIGRFAFLGTENVNLYFAANTLPATLQSDWDHGIAGYYLGVSEVDTSGDFTYAILSDGSVALIEYNGTEKSLDLNALNLGGPIITIGGKAFYYSELEQITLPDTLLTIQSYAFYHANLKSLTLPASLTFIGRDAFAYTSIETLTIPENAALSVIEQSAFEATESLRSVTLPASLTTLGRSAFQGSGITELHFASGIRLTEIPEGAFAYTSITSLTIPDSVKLLDHNAFRETADLASVNFGSAEELMIMSNVFYRSGLSSLTVPKNVSYIGEYAFVALPNLTAFEVDTENSYYTAIDGLLCSKDGRRLIAAPAGRTGTIAIPASIEIIGFGAFEGSALTEVTFSESANLLSLGYRAFYGCKQLTSIEIPASVVAIDYYAFAECTALRAVTYAEGSSLTGIYEGAFLGCVQLSDITVPDGVIEISDFAFYGCADLTRIPISENSQLKGIYSYAMAYTGLRDGLTTPEGLIDIGDYAFSGTKITSFTVPNTNARQLLLGIGVLRDCNSVTSVNIPFIGASFEDNKITWFSYLFGAGSYEASSVYIPESLDCVTISEGLTHIGSYAFYNLDLDAVREINLPHSIVSLGSFAFHQCHAAYELTNTVSLDSDTIDIFHQYFGYGMQGTLRLAEGLERIELTISGISGLYLPASLSYVEPQALTMNQHMEFIEISPESPYFTSLNGVLYNKACDEIVAVPGGIKGCVTLPSTLTEVRADAFRECHKITELIIPEGVVTIEAGAFAGNVNLTRLTLPSTLQTIGNDAFSACLSLFVIENNSALALNFNSEEHGEVAYFAKTILNADGSIQFVHDGDGNEYYQTEDGFHFIKLGGEYTLIAYLGDEEHIRLPEKVRGQSYRIEHMVGGKHITVPGTLGDLAIAFTDNQTIESVVLEEGITELGDSAFSCCYALRSVTLPEGLERIGAGAFNMCSRVIELKLPSTLKSIGNAAFDFGGLVTLELPEGVEEIGAGAFRYCTQLESLTLPASLTVIGESAFESCESLDVLEIAEGNRHFVEEGGIIYNSTQTEMVYVLPTVKGRVELPDTLLTIPDTAFAGMSAITEVEIPDGLRSIGYCAFEGTSITEIDLPASLELLDSDSLCTPTLNTIRYGGTLYQWLNLRRGYTNSTKTVDLYLGDTRLVDVVIPEGITEIPSDAFALLTIESVTLPSTLERIGDRAFTRCAALEELHLPAALSEIADYAFDDCSALRKITVDPANQSFSVCDGVLYNKSQTEIRLVPKGLSGEIRIPEGVTHIPDHAFGMLYLASLTLPSSLTSMGDHAFANLGLGIVYNNSDLPLRAAGSSAVGTYANAKCIVDKNGNRTYVRGAEDYAIYVTDDDFLYVRQNGKYYLKSYLGDADTVTLPLTLDGHVYEPDSVQGIKHLVIPSGFTEICSHAFSFSATLQSVLIPNGVTAIGTAAFTNCPNLRTINIPDSVTALGGNVISDSRYFHNAENWTDEGLLLVGNHLIAVSPDCEYVTVPESIRSVAETAFEGCYKLRQLTMRGDYGAWQLLSPLSNLETLVLSNNLTQPIGEYFYTVPLTLKSVVLLDSVQMSPDRAQWIMAGMEGVRIYIQGEEKDLKWDENFPGWSNGNTVLYGSRWIFVSFYAEDGRLISSAPFSSAQVIRQPWVDSYTDDVYRYVFEGFDINGDGIADPLPATSTTWITANAVYTREFRCVREGHLYRPDQSVDDHNHLLVCACGATAQGAHKWMAPLIITQATHTQEGVREITCAGCHHKKTETIEKTPEHTFDQFVVSDSYLAEHATCAHPNAYYVSCVCGAHDTLVFHDGELSNVHSTEGAIFGSAGEAEHAFTCRDCGSTVFLPHEWSGWTVNPNNEQEMIRTCTVCGDSETAIDDTPPNNPNNPDHPDNPNPSNPNEGGPSGGNSSSGGGCMGLISTPTACLILLSPFFTRKKKQKRK